MKGYPAFFYDDIEYGCEDCEISEIESISIHKADNEASDGQAGCYEPFDRRAGYDRSV